MKTNVNTQVCMPPHQQELKWHKKPNRRSDYNPSEKIHNERKEGGNENKEREGERKRNTDKLAATILLANPDIKSFTTQLSTAALHCHSSLRKPTLLLKQNSECT
jgi:hypothetical protein